MMFDSTVALPYGIYKMSVFAIFFSIAGQFGDLLESSIKRHFGVKDSGKFIPGHGGVLDRFDSMLLVFPITDLLVRPGFDILSNVWYQKVHGFVEASSVFGGCIINGNPDLPGHHEDVNEMRQIEL